MFWLVFLVSTAVLVVAAVKLAEYGDVIGLRTGLGGLFVGTLLLAGATSLPELLTAISSINQGVPDLTVGNVFGSSMFNMFMIAMLDLIHRQGGILKQVAINHAISGGLAVMLTGLAVFFILGDVDIRVGWVGLDSILLIAVYFGGTYALRAANPGDELLPPPEPSPEVLEGVPSLRRAVIGFSAAAGVLLVVTPLLVDSSVQVAEALGLTTGFVGVALLAIVTSLPELVTGFSAVRIGAYDLAVGNLFGSNIFNIFALGFTDVFYTKGALLTDLQPPLALAGLLALIMTALAVILNLARLEWRFRQVELDAMLLVVIYVLGMLFLYLRGVAV